MFSFVHKYNTAAFSRLLCSLVQKLLFQDPFTLFVWMEDVIITWSFWFANEMSPWKWATWCNIQCVHIHENFTGVRWPQWNVTFSNSRLFHALCVSLHNCLLYRSPNLHPPLPLPCPSLSPYSLHPANSWPEPLLDGLCQLCYQLVYSHAIVPHASRWVVCCLRHYHHPCHHL